MDIAHLEAFLEAAKLGSFRRAAQQLHLSQPSLSARVQALEQELQTTLFHRMGRGVRMTEMGKTLYPFAERAVEAVRQGRIVIDHTRQAAGGLLNLAAARAIGTYTLPAILECFRRLYPDIKVHITVGRSSDVLQAVADGQVEVGLARTLTNPKVLTMHLYDEEICLVTHPSHAFARRGSASIYDVAREPLILYDRGSSYFLLIEQVCRSAGIVPWVEMILDSIEVTKRLVELDMGISFLPRSGIKRELEAGSLALVPLTEGHRVVLPTSVMLRRSATYGPPTLAFMAVLADMYDADLSELGGEARPPRLRA